MNINTDAEPPDLWSAPTDVALGQLIPGLSNLVGAIPPKLVPSSCRTGLLNNAPTWQGLAAATIDDILQWPGVGPGRARGIFRFAQQIPVSPPTEVVAATRASAALSEVDASLQVVAAWAIHNGSSVGLSEAMRVASRPGTPPSVVAAADYLETLDLTTIALTPDERSFDHEKAAHELLASFDDREQAILERAVAGGLRQVPTLDEIGRRFNLTRERIRQLQAPVEARLLERLRLPDYDVLVGRAQVLSVQLGVACPVEDLPADLQPGASPTAELLAYLAGPFRVVDGWLIQRDLGISPAGLASELFDAVADDYGIAEADALFDALSSAGVAQSWHQRLPLLAKGVTQLDGRYVRWGTHVERLTSMLAAAGRPMTSEELAAKAQSVEPGIAVRSMLNALAGDSFRRTGRGRYELASWGGDDYRGIVTEMVEVLAEGEVSIARLSADLADRFGVSAASVAMSAQMHPRFVSARGVVRLRRDDEPFEITSRLEESDRCYVIDGAWAWRVRVDYDLLRGSGRAIPEAFAAHFGASPKRPISVDVGGRELKIGWSMTAWVGSLRRCAEELGLIEGDWMFMRYSSDGATFLPLPASTLRAASSDERVRLLVGASRDDQRSLCRCLADAVGITATEVTMGDVVKVLEARGEADLLASMGSDGTLSTDHGRDWHPRSDP